MQQFAKMVQPKFYIKTTVLSLLAWVPLLLFGKPIIIGGQNGKEPLSLKPFFTIIEDVNNTVNADQLYLDSSSFVPLSQLKLDEPNQSLTRQLKGTVTTLPKNGLSYLFIFSNTRYYAHINY